MLLPESGRLPKLQGNGPAFTARMAMLLASTLMKDFRWFVLRIDAFHEVLSDIVYPDLSHQRHDRYPHVHGTISFDS